MFCIKEFPQICVVLFRVFVWVDVIVELVGSNWTWRVLFWSRHFLHQDKVEEYLKSRVMVHRGQCTIQLVVGNGLVHLANCPLHRLARCLGLCGLEIRATVGWWGHTMQFTRRPAQWCGWRWSFLFVSEAAVFKRWKIGTKKYVRVEVFGNFFSPLEVLFAFGKDFFFYFFAFCFIWTHTQLVQSGFEYW